MRGPTVVRPVKEGEACLVARFAPAPASRFPPVVQGVFGVAAPGLVTLLALLPTGVSPTSAALAYVLAVIAVAVAAGFWAGLGASGLSFLALNFFFTPPVHTFSVSKEEDLVALLVFLVVSATVGTLLSTALAQRTRAERREREARLIHHLGTRLLAGEKIEDVLGRAADGMRGLFELARCEVTIGARLPVDEEGADRKNGAEIFPMLSRGREEGRIVVDAGLDRPPLSEQEREVIRTFAGQIALALETVRFASEVENARVEADVQRTRAALFSSVSHDLRTPLASITAAVTSLQGRDATFDPQARDDLLETIRQEADRLNRLVGNFLHLSRIRAGTFVPAWAPVAVDEVIEGVVARMQPVVKGHRIRLQIRENLPEVPADLVQIEQVVVNLLENAAKFSPPGSEIRISAVRWENAVQVRVTDRGTGIPPHERQRVFEPFFRARGDTGTGTGLGLAIAKAIVDAHGGSIWIEGAPGGGAAVAFQLPMRPRSEVSMGS